MYYVYIKTQGKNEEISTIFKLMTFQPEFYTWYFFDLLFITQIDIKVIILNISYYAERLLAECLLGWF